MSKKKVEEVKNNKNDSKETGKDSDNKKEIKNSKEKDTSKVKNKSSENKKRTKTDDYYDELTKENKIVDIIKEQDEEYIKEEYKTQDNKSITKNKITKFDMFFLNIQFFLSIITFILAIVYFFNKSIIIVLQIVLGLTMFVTGINNIKVYKRKALTVFYFVLGIALLVLAVITMLGK